MKINRRNLKAIVLSLGLGVAMLSTTPVQAQMINLLDEYYDEMDAKNSQSTGSLLGGGRGDTPIEGGGISNYGIGETVPMGSGFVILLGAGLGYAVLKKKEDEQ